MPYDILLTAERDLPQRSSHVTGMEIVAQRVETRLRTFLGEWILDRTKGLDFLGWTQMRPVSVDLIGLQVRREIESTPGVKRVLNFEGSLDTSTQVLAYSGQVVVEDEEEPLTFSILPLGDDPASNVSALITFTAASGRVVTGSPVAGA